MSKVPPPPALAVKALAAWRARQAAQAEADRAQDRALRQRARKAELAASTARTTRLAEDVDALLATGEVSSRDLGALDRLEREKAAAEAAIALVATRKAERSELAEVERRELATRVVSQCANEREAAVADLRRILAEAVRPLLLSLVRADAIETRATGGLPSGLDDALMAHLFSGRIVAQRFVEALPKRLQVESLSFAEIVKEAAAEADRLSK